MRDGALWHFVVMGVTHYDEMRDAKGVVRVTVKPLDAA